MKQISAKRTVFSSFLVNILDMLMHGIVMYITGSVVMLAGSFEGAADLIATGLLLIGLKISRKRRDVSHPFGYGKALFSWTLISAIVMLIFGAGLSFWFGFKRFLDPEKIDHLWLAYAALLISILTNGYVLQLSSKRLLNGQSVNQIFRIFMKSVHLETKNTFVLDFAGTFAAVLGLISLILYQITGWQHFDGLGGMLIGLIIGIASIILIWEIKNFLIGKPAPRELEQRIKNAAMEIDGVTSINGLETMYVGSERLLVELNIHVSHVDSIKEIEKILDKVRERVKKEIPLIYSLHIELN